MKRRHIFNHKPFLCTSLIIQTPLTSKHAPIRHHSLPLFFHQETPITFRPMTSLDIAVATMVSMAVMLCSTCQATGNLHPLILIPGNGGNQLEARLTATYKPTSLWCKWYPIKKDGDGWFRLWFDPSVLLSPLTKCFSERMMLYYDSEFDDYYNAPGVETRVPNFGSTQSLLYLDPNLK